MPRVSARRGSFAALLCLALAVAGCTSSPLPTSPSAVAGATMTGPLPLLFEPSLSGSAYQLSGFSASDSVLSFFNNQGSFAVAFDSSTTFRRTAPTSPADPYTPACRTHAEWYNSLGSVSNDSASLAAVLAAMAADSCKARIIVQNSNFVPPNPVRILSFQPIP